MLQLENGINVGVEANTEGHVITKVQEIPQGFLDNLKREKFESTQTREKEYQRVASIPVVLVERWLKEGYNVFEEPIRKTIAKLKNEHMEFFVTTGKEV